MEKNIVSRISEHTIYDMASFEEVTEAMSAFKSRYPTGSNFRVKVGQEYDTLYFYFECDDYETDAEYEARIEKEKLLKQIQDAKDKQTYIELKKKFEGEK